MSSSLMRRESFCFTGHTREQRVKDAFFIVEPNREQLTRISRMIDAGKLRVFRGRRVSVAGSQSGICAQAGKNVLVVDH
jgi:hypothetical protein